jgi:hypothetical protein
MFAVFGMALIRGQIRPAGWRAKNVCLRIKDGFDSGTRCDSPATVLPAA